jgi:hypothetical protein
VRAHNRSTTASNVPRKVSGAASVNGAVNLVSEVIPPAGLAALRRDSRALYSAALLFR